MLIHNNLIIQINKVGGSLVQKLTLGKRIKENLKPNFPAFPAVSIPAQDILRSLYSNVDARGHETARFFRCKDGQFRGLADEAFKELSKLCLSIAKGKGNSQLVSFETLQNESFDWLNLRFDGLANTTLADHLLSSVGSQILDRHYVFPIGTVAVEKPFSIGPVIFSSFDLGFFTPYRAEAITENELEELNELMADYQAEHQGYARASVNVRAEPVRGEQIAGELVEQALGILLTHSKPMIIAQSSLPYVKVGLVKPPQARIFQMNLNNEILDSSESWLGTSHHQWLITTELLGMMKKSGVEEIGKIIGNSSATAFQQTVLDAFLLYSRAATVTTLAEKLLYIIGALESLLSKDSNEPLQQNVADRLALFLADSSSARKRIIKTYKSVYAMRSKYVHHGEFIEPIEEVDRFLLDVFTFFVLLSFRTGDFSTQQKFHEYLDDVKYSGVNYVWKGSSWGGTGMR